MTRFRRWIAIVPGLLILPLVSPAPLAVAQVKPASISPSGDVARKMIMTGRLRMLSQYMVKAACFASLGVDEKAQIAEMRFVHRLFDDSLLELRAGSILYNTRPEYDGDILATLDAVDVRWEAFGSAVLRQDLAMMVIQNEAILDKLDESMSLFQKKYSANGVVAPESAAALNISSRQSMLTQKASKEFCLVAAHADEKGNRARLKSTITSFEKLLAALVHGDASLGLPADPVGQVVDQIVLADRDWHVFSSNLTRVAEGAAPSAEDLVAVSRQNVSVLQDMNSIVQVYELLSE